jgi:hypothetical protein
VDDFDRILTLERAVTPSPRFASRVMVAVRRLAAAPPIAFPWRRVAPALAIAGLAFVVALVIFAVTLVRSSTPLEALARSPVADLGRTVWAWRVVLIVAPLLASGLTALLALRRVPRPR